MVSTTTLKNAAFAIEHDLFTDSDGCNYLVKDGAILRRWEPETSSADAFELAVMLDLLMEPRLSQCNDYTYNHFGYSEDESKEQAMRYAIIECAASIGAAL